MLKVLNLYAGERLFAPTSAFTMPVGAENDLLGIRKVTFDVSPFL